MNENEIKGLKEVKEIPKTERKPSIYKEIIKTFLNSNMNLAEIDVEKLSQEGKVKTKSALSLYNSFKWAAGDMKANVKIIRRGTKIYLKKVEEVKIAQGEKNV